MIWPNMVRGQWLCVALVLGCTSVAVAGLQRRPTFAADVAPLLHAHCVTCHQPDRAAPFALLSYDEAKSRAKEIRAAVSARQMPPWSAAASSTFPQLLHDRRLTTRQIDTIVSWVDAGTPSGDLSRMPPLPNLPASWPLGLPDLTLTFPRAMSLPADSASRAFNVVLYMNLPQERWLTGIDYRPTSRDLLSHAVIYAAPAGMVIGEEDPLPGYSGQTGPGAGSLSAQMAAVDRSLEPVGVWTPGGRRLSTPDGLAIRLPKGSNIVMQFHAKAADTGAVEDGTVALYFLQAARATPLTSIQVPASMGIVAGVDIPAGDSRKTIASEFVLPIDVSAFGARGHAHALGRDLKLTARLPNGQTRGLLWIDRWDLRWQETYYFKSLIRLPKGTTLRAEVTYDASPKRIVWGPRLEDEVAAMDLIIAVPSPAEAATLATARAAAFRDQLLKAIGK